MKRNRIAAALACAAVALAGAATLTSTAIAGPHSHDKATIGHEAPDFTLKDFNGNTHTLSKYIEDDKIVVLEWFNPTCPAVKPHYVEQDTMNKLAADYKGKDVIWLSINSSNKDNPGHTKCAETIEKWGVNHPVLDDADGKVGKMYGATNTPHMFVISSDGILAYSGAIDNDSRNKKSGNEKVNYVKNALDELVTGNKVSTTSVKPYGCSVKYAK